MAAGQEGRALGRPPATQLLGPRGGRYPLDVAPLGGAGSLGVGGPLTERRCANVGMPGSE